MSYKYLALDAERHNPEVVDADLVEVLRDGVGGRDDGAAVLQHVNQLLHFRQHGVALPVSTDRVQLRLHEVSHVALKARPTESEMTSPWAGLDFRQRLRQGLLFWLRLVQHED